MPWAGTSATSATSRRASRSLRTHLTIEAGVALRAAALVCAVAVLAGATVQAGARVALIDVMLAVAAREARWAQAGKGVDAVHAGAAIETGAGGGWVAGSG